MAKGGGAGAAGLVDVEILAVNQQCLQSDGDFRLQSATSVGPQQARSGSRPARAFRAYPY